MAQCGSCGKEMNEDAIFCDNCGSAALPVSASGDTVEAPSFYSDPPVENDFEVQEAVTNDEAQPKKKRSKTPLVIVLCVLFVIALVAVVLLLKNNASTRVEQEHLPEVTSAQTIYTTDTPVISPNLLYSVGIDESLPRVDDGAGILSEAAVKTLDVRAKEIALHYHMDFVIVTRRGLNGKSPMEFADDYFDYEGYGWREEDTDDITTGSGILLLLNMVGPGNNDIWISTKGEGISVFNDGALDYLIEAIKPELVNRNYEIALERFLDEARGYLEGNPDRARSDQIIGTYQGSYKAADGLYWGVTLHIKEAANEGYEAIFECYASALQTYPDSVDLGPGSWRCAVEYDMPSGTYSIIANEWIQQPDWLMDSFYECKLSGGGNTLSGVVKSSMYSSSGENFSIQRITEPSTQNAPGAISIQPTLYVVVFEDEHTLRIRTGPTIEFTQIGSVPKSSVVIATKICDDWAYVSYGGIAGWSSMEYLQLLE